MAVLLRFYSLDSRAEVVHLLIVRQRQFDPQLMLLLECVGQDFNPQCCSA